MVNTEIYENADKSINSRIWVRNKALYTKAVTFRPYYYLLKKLDAFTNAYNHYILLSEEDLSDCGYIKHQTRKNGYGTTIISLFNIWDDLNITTSDENVYGSLTLDEHDDVSEIYKLSI